MFSRWSRIFSYFQAVYLHHSLQRISVALSRAAAVCSSRRIDETQPASWEFSAFSQNREDGIIDYLAGLIVDPNRYFIEIGAADGIENNTAWLAIAKKWRGLMIEANQKASRMSAALYAKLNLGVECACLFVSGESVDRLKNCALHTNPDVLSLDIDGNDYYVASALLKAGFRPRIFAVEYNSAFGPDNSITIEYRPDFNYLKAHPSGLYYGAAISAWRRLFARYGYQFVTVDSNGVNAFFVDAGVFNRTFTDKLRGLEFRENFYQFRKFRGTWESQFEQIKTMPFLVVK